MRDSRLLTKRIGIGIVLHRKHVLVGVRHADQVLAGYDEFPGGKCESAESPEACCIRECLEETGLHVCIDRLLHRIHHTYEHDSVDLSFFVCRVVESNADDLNSNPSSQLDQMPQVSNGFHWVSATRLGELNFPKANQPVLDILNSELSGF